MGEVFSLWDATTSTPDKIIGVFYKSYNQEDVRLQLWEVFRGFAFKDKTLNFLLNDDEVAALFDQLIDLVGAIQSLQNTEMEKCFFCKRTGVIAPGQI